MPDLSKLLTGISLKSLLAGIVGVFLIALAWSWHSRGNTINDLRSDIAAERHAHEITLSSLAQATRDLSEQTSAVEAQRAAREQLSRDLAVAVAASVPSQGVIDRLIASSRAAPAGPRCDPSETVRSIWP